MKLSKGRAVDALVFAEYVTDIAATCRQRGLHTVAVTTACVAPAARAELFGEIDAANVDLKGFTGAVYRDLCLWLAITTLLAPGRNDSDREIEQETRLRRRERRRVRQRCRSLGIAGPAGRARAVARHHGEENDGHRDHELGFPARRADPAPAYRRR